ncbi:MAG: hypothetical protein ACQESR_09825 [Planctomycetota bacterium]
MQSPPDMMLYQQLRRLLPVILTTGLVLGELNCIIAAENSGVNLFDFNHQPVPLIPPGTIVGKDNPNGWNRLVLLAKPRLAGGAVEELSAMARDLATQFPVVIMARVRARKTNEDRVEYRLENVGVGICTEIAGRNVVVSSDSHDELDADLNTIERIVLGQNEKMLKKITRIVHTHSFVVFDVKARLLHAGKHRDAHVRHLVWVSPESGKVASVVWPLIEDGEGRYQLLGKTLSALPGGFEEDRIIHVSADEVTFGIPSARAFALARMPRGKKIPVTPKLASLATQKKYDRASLSKLIQMLRDAF